MVSKYKDGDKYGNKFPNSRNKYGFKCTVINNH